MSVTVGKMARYCPTAGNGPTDYIGFSIPKAEIVLKI